MLAEHNIQASNVTSRPPTKEEIRQAPLHHTFWSEGDPPPGCLLENPELFQLGLPFHVEYNPFRHGYRDSDATYKGEVNFNLFGLAGKCATDLNVAYTYTLKYCCPSESVLNESLDVMLH